VHGTISESQNDEVTVPSLLSITALHAALGLLIAAGGVPLARSKVAPNHLYGFRVSKTLSSPGVWYAANRVAGVDACIGGMVIALAALLLGVLGAALDIRTVMMINLFVLGASLTAMVAHSFWALRKL
jgi:uncharacterized membrane protein